MTAYGLWRSLLLPAAIAMAALTPAFGATLLAPPFQDHAVLQRDTPIRLWGEAVPSQTVTATFAGEQARAVADASGHWQIALPPLPAGGPYDLSIAAGRESETLHDILVGDVWLCSGQSNMELPVRATTNGDTEIANAASDRIRLLQVVRTSSGAPLTSLDASAKWTAASPVSAKEFSAACFYFARELRKSMDVPMGLIDSSWGGSIIQTWISADEMRTLGGYDQPLSVLADFLKSPDAARAHWQTVMDAWWLAHDPASRATQPWSAADYDDSGWSTMTLNGWWESSGIPAFTNFDGIVWFRTTVTLTPAQATQGATLTLGPVDDIDSTWVNGVHLGGSEGWDQPRSYALAPGTLKAGNNVIAVGVLDTGGGGGMWGPAEKRALTFADGSVLPLAQSWRYKIAAPLTETGGAPHAPWADASGTTALYNGMIAPLAPYQVRGALWYQGEANVAEAREYARLLPGMMADWRRAFGEPDMPFLIVQLPDFGPATGAPVESAWADLREVQRETVLADPHTALAATIDIGDRYDIHPTNKQEVGRRLALAARRLVYGENVVASGPVPVSATLVGANVTIGFANTPLVVYGDKRPIGFQLCDAGAHCAYADARVVSDRVVLDVPKGVKPVRVRFCWADSPVCNLYNSDALPAVPFEMALSVGHPRVHRLPSKRTR
jgi:sialate O-acetylesterase